MLAPFKKLERWKDRKQNIEDIKYYGEKERLSRGSTLSLFLFVTEMDAE